MFPPVSWASRKPGLSPLPVLSPTWTSLTSTSDHTGTLPGSLEHMGWWGEVDGNLYVAWPQCSMCPGLHSRVGICPSCQRPWGHGGPHAQPWVWLGCTERAGSQDGRMGRGKGPLQEVPAPWATSALEKLRRRWPTGHHGKGGAGCGPTADKVGCGLAPRGRPPESRKRGAGGVTVRCPRGQGLLLVHSEPLPRGGQCCEGGGCGPCKAALVSDSGPPLPPKVQAPGGWGLL